MRLAELVRRATRRGDRTLRLWRPSWPTTAYLEVKFSANGVLEPTGRAAITDGEGRELAVETVVMLFAPITDDYSEWGGAG